MMLKVMNSIENIVDKYARDYRFFNDKDLNVVCQLECDSENMEHILCEIDQNLPLGINFSHAYSCGSFEITFKEIGDDSMVNEYVAKSILLNASIENEFGPLDWVDTTVHQEDGTGSISFTGPTLSERDWEPGAFKGAEDAFFAKMRRIKEMIKNCGFAAELIKFEADCDCPYSEATININFDGAEL